MTRSFGVDVLTCPRCGDRLHLPWALAIIAVVLHFVDHKAALCTADY
jgi:hypothetical protein